MHLSPHPGFHSGNRLTCLLRAMCLMLALSSAMFSTPGHAVDAANRQQAIEIAVRQNGGGGKVLGVQTLTEAGGQTVYAVKILSNGRVRVFRIRQAR